MSNKSKKGKVILKVIREVDGKLTFKVESQINEAFEVVINLLGELSRATGLGYNEILNDLKDTKEGK